MRWLGSTALAIMLVAMPVSAQERGKPEPGTERSSGQWVIDDTAEPTPAGVKQAIDGLKSVTVGEIQKMKDADLKAVLELCRTWIDLIAAEQKRRGNQYTPSGLTDPK